MKFLKYFVIVLLSLTAIFLLIGIISPKIEYENKVTINRPVNEVFSYFTYPDNLKKWMTGLQSIEPVKGIPLTFGSQYKLIFLQRKDTMLVTEEVTSFKPNAEFGFHLHNDVFECHATLTFISNGYSTELTNHNVVEGKSLFVRSLLSMLRSSLKGREQRVYESFKKVVEAGPMVSQTL